jgi:fibronectin type 3 domain-containing protein
VQTRYELASAPGSVTATAASNRLTITWQKSENLGGSTYVVYRLESNSGSGWVLRGATTGSSYALPLQAKGQAVSYRVIAQTSAGYSTPSAEIRVVG